MYTEEDFEEKYTLVLNHFYDDPEDCSWSGCAFETYGHELEYIEKMVDNLDYRNVWTVTEDDDTLTINAGFRKVNRYFYLVTEEPWESEDEFYVCETIEPID
jgi:hypothetical protein